MSTPGKNRDTIFQRTANGSHGLCTNLPRAGIARSGTPFFQGSEHHVWISPYPIIVYFFGLPVKDIWSKKRQRSIRPKGRDPAKLKLASARLSRYAIQLLKSAVSRISHPLGWKGGTDHEGFPTTRKLRAQVARPGRTGTIAHRRLFAERAAQCYGIGWFAQRRGRQCVAPPGRVAQRWSRPNRKTGPVRHLFAAPRRVSCGRQRKCRASRFGLLPFGNAQRLSKWFQNPRRAGVSPAQQA